MDIIAKQVDMPEHIKNDVDLACSSSSPKALWRIVDQDFPVNGVKLGKVLGVNMFGRTMDSLGLDCTALGEEQEMLAMIPVSWDGEFDPADPECVLRLQQKLGIENVVVSETAPLAESIAVNQIPQSDPAFLEHD